MYLRFGLLFALAAGWCFTGSAQNADGTVSDPVPSAIAPAAAATPAPTQTTSLSAQQVQQISQNNLNSTGPAYDDVSLPGLNRVTYSTVDPINPNFILEGLNRGVYVRNTLNLSYARELAQLPLSEAFPAANTSAIGVTTGTGGGTAAAPLHPIMVLTAIGVNWLAGFFMIIGLLCGVFSVVSFLHAPDYGAFLRKCSGWLLLAGFSGIMSFLVW